MKKKITIRKKNRLRKMIARMFVLAIVLVALVGMLCAVVYFMLTHRPTEYKPKTLTKTLQKQAEKRGWKKLEEFHNQAYLDEPFVLTVDQQMINKVIMLDDVQGFYRRNWPRAAEQFHRPQIAFGNDCIRLMGQLSCRGETSVLTIVLEPSITENCRLQLNLASVLAGSLKLPEAIVDQQLDLLAKRMSSVLKRSREQKNTKPESNRENELIERLPEWLEELVEKKRLIVDTFPAAPDRRVRIVGVKIDAGRLQLTMQGFAKSK